MDMTEVQLKMNPSDIVGVIGNVTSPFVVLSELIKNGVDANARSVTVHIDTPNRSIRVVDNGDGFTVDDIYSLSAVAESKKKADAIVRNGYGEMLLGSKGLAFYSVFSLGNQIEVRTRNKNEEMFHLLWNKGDSYFTFSQLDDAAYSHGTEIIITEIEEDALILLSSEKELGKFKHISLYNFQKKPTLPRVTVVKDGTRIDIDVANIHAFIDEFSAVVSFRYDSDNDSLVYKYVVDDPRVKSQELVIPLGNTPNVDEWIKKNYSIKPTGLSFEDYLTNSLIERSEIRIPSFEGEFFMKRGRKSERMNKFESGIRIYVNKFALYNFLNKNNDWLQLTNVSQVKKINNYRQHNVFGFVNFDNFNEAEQDLVISNERGGFIENITYHKFLDIMYKYVLCITINIDVALKNNLFIGTPGADDSGADGSGTGGSETGGSGADGSGADGSGTGGSGTGGSETGGSGTGGSGTGGSGTGGPGTGGPGTGGPGTGGPGTGGPGTGGPGTGQQENNQILKLSQLTIYQGENCYLLDPTIVRARYLEDLRVIPRSNSKIHENVFLHDNPPGEFDIDYYSGGLKETLHITVNKRNVLGGSTNSEFFTTSSHFNGTIDLKDISGLVHQLRGLKYNDKYLLYIVSFRAIIEDIVKRYYAKRPLTLKSNLKDNVTAMLSDIQDVLQIAKPDPMQAQKSEIKKLFKGHDSLNNFLASVNVKFSNQNYDKFLHSLAHNPAKIDHDLAIEVANDIILPLHALSHLLSDKGII